MLITLEDITKLKAQGVTGIRLKPGSFDQLLSSETIRLAGIIVTVPADNEPVGIAPDEFIWCGVRIKRDNDWKAGRKQNSWRTR